MREMTKETQMRANGGAWVHCTHCGKDFWGITSNKAKEKFMRTHKSSSCRFWDYGRFVDCKHCH